MAVQSHFFGVGSVVTWAEAGVGGVATQSVVEPAYGPRGLALMRDGKSAPAALHQLLADDPQEAVRQVAMIDRGGRVAVHTGARCIAQAGHAVGDQVSAQANMMERDTVPAAMVRAYSSASGAGFAERLLAALDAAEAEGGDLRGRQSAALLVVAPRATGSPVQDSPVDLLRLIRPDLLVKGGDYRRDGVPEGPLVEALGGRVEILPYLPDQSTTAMLQRIRTG